MRQLTTSKNGGLLLILFFTTFFAISQNTKEYYVEIANGHDLGTVQKTTNTDQTVSITTDIASFSATMNSKQLFEFKEAFPGAESGTRLEKIYKISLEENESTADIVARNDVA